MTQNDEALLARLVDALAEVDGIAAIVLGGSRARGAAKASSDYDIGLYYEPEHPLDTAALARGAASLDDRGAQAAVTAIGEWGPWINGGAWLTIGGRRVDLLYRDLGRVRTVIADCRAGRVERHYQPGHPHAFISAIYAGEIALCRPLYDLQGIVASLKRDLAEYPPALAETLSRLFLFEAEFALANARHGSGLDDIHYVAGCCFRSVASLCQVLFALNGAWLLNEKGAVAAVERLALKPHDFAARVAAAYRALGHGAKAGAVDQLATLVSETGALSRR